MKPSLFDYALALDIWQTQLDRNLDYNPLLSDVVRRDVSLNLNYNSISKVIVDQTIDISVLNIILDFKQEIK